MGLYIYRGHGCSACTPVTRWFRHTWSCMGSCGGTVWVGELCRGMHTSQMVHTYTHCLQYCQHKEDSALFSHQLPPVPPLSLVSAHSSSQVVHCRVFPPLPLHAPVLVLHLAVYSASPTQGRVGLTDRLTHMQCTDTVQCEQLSKVAPNEWVPTMVLLLTTPTCLQDTCKEEH